MRVFCKRSICQISFSHFIVRVDTGGEEGIRTPDTVTGIHDFESRAFNQLCHLSTSWIMRIDTHIQKIFLSCICLHKNA